VRAVEREKRSSHMVPSLLRKTVVREQQRFRPMLETPSG
jgi:chromosome condensin MukBEF ATPase and DNA-binding subunit MukB